MTCPVDYLSVTFDIIHYLHDQGVVQDPTQQQTATDNLPAVWAGGLQPSLDHGVAIIGPWQDNTDSDASPLARFMVVVRSKPDDMQSLIETSQAVFTALHRPDHPFDLTATQKVMFCRRIVNDPPVPDENRRFIRVETYQTRLEPPTP